MQTVVTLTVMKDPIRQFYSVIADNDTIGRQFDNNETQLKIVRPEDGSLDDLSLSINFQELLPSINLANINTCNIPKQYMRGTSLSIQLQFTDESLGVSARTNVLRFKVTQSIVPGEDDFPFTAEDKDQLDSNSEFINKLKNEVIVISGGNSTTKRSE